MSAVHSNEGPAAGAPNETRIPEVAAADLDLTNLLRPGDCVVVVQGAAEPLALTRALREQSEHVQDVTVFCGLTYSDYLMPGGGVRLRSYGALGKTRRRVEAGLEIVPCHMSAIARWLRTGALRPDVLFLQLSPPTSDGRYTLGVGVDYAADALIGARTVIAEVNRQMPCTRGPVRIDPKQVHASVRTDRPLIAVPPSLSGVVEQAIAEHVAELVPDGATIQLGIGTVPDACARALRGHRNLGIHSGLVTDVLVDLVESGAVTNDRKGLHEGVTVAGFAVGTERLYRYVDQNVRVEFHPVSTTHDPRVLAGLSCLVAVNSAVEVDLTGQVNAECAGGTPMGATGGQVDFLRGAAASADGLAVIALPSKTTDGRRSRIVGRLSGPVTSLRTDVDVVVSEHGVADLRGRTDRERTRAMLTIADPAFRHELQQ